MLKNKLLSRFLFALCIVVFGTAIYTFLLKPSQEPTSNSPANADALSTELLFAAVLPNENGVNTALSQYKGKTIVLNFWATWCPPCREEMPELSQLQQDFKAKNVVVLGIAIDELALVKEFSVKQSVSYPLFADEDSGMQLAATLGNDKGVLPYTVIINSEGIVTNTFFGRITNQLLTEHLLKLSPAK